MDIIVTVNLTVIRNTFLKIMESFILDLDLVPSLPLFDVLVRDGGKSVLGI